MLRLARPEDAPPIALMSRELIEFGLGWRYNPDHVRRLIRNPDTLVLVAADRERIVGFAIMEFGDERAHLVLLAVQAERQRRGAGRRMVHWLLESATTAGIASIHLELRARNTAARAFYLALGFADTVLIPGYYSGREAAVRMVRILRTPNIAPLTWQPKFPWR
jgi:ribosomal-protein-alanine N-acetyltransferase